MNCVTMTEAARRLQVSVAKIRALVREGVLPVRANPLDKREKLIPVAAVERLAQLGESREPPWPRSIGIIADPTFQSEDAEAWTDMHTPRYYDKLRKR